MSDLLEIEVRLLVLRRGLENVLRALAATEGVSEAELLNRVERHRTAVRLKGRTKPPVDPNPILEQSCDPVAARALFGAYDDGRFLPRLQDVRSFLQSRGKPGSAKSRKTARLAIARVIAELSADTLRSLQSEAPPRSSQSAFEQLASQIMRNPDSGEAGSDEPKP